MRVMTTTKLLARLALLGALLVAVLAPAGASAKIIELGATDDPPTPACPGPKADDEDSDAPKCYVVSRTTGYQGKIEGQNNIVQAPRDGRIVAWSITLSQPRKSEIEFFNRRLGAAPSAGISVFSTAKHYGGTIVAASPVQQLTNYLGRTVQFPLGTSLPILKDQRVALTVPTWAPALAVGLPDNTSWRANRGEDDCDDTGTQTAATSVGRTVKYDCRYKAAQLTYSVTMITTPKPNELPKKKKAKGN